MPPAAILDPATLDNSDVVYDKAKIHELNPQRYEFDLLDAVIHVDMERQIFAGYHDLRPDAWWVRGHIPGRPLFPGVLMIEVAAQLASLLTHALAPSGRFIGFGGVDNVKFRGAIEPPARFLVIGKALEIRSRKTVCQAQGFVRGAMVFEAVITGMPL